MHRGARAVGIHGRRARCEHHLDVFAAKEFEVGFQRARVASRSSPAPNCKGGLTKIDTTTTEPGTFLAARTSAKCPWCNAPMVGTNMTRRPVCRSARVTSEIACGT